MFLEEFIKQHRVHRFVANGERLALLIASHLIGVHLFHLLSNEAELRDAIGVKLVLVAEGDRFERKDMHRLLPESGYRGEADNLS
jgi:predicted xylose isomerase-like sugar epimerase